MKKIALFGGTGRTGQLFVKKAAEKGYRINLLARDKSNLKSTANIDIIKGDVLNYNDVEKTIEGTDAVVDLIGHKEDSPANLQTIGIKFIIDSMKKNNVRRLIVLTGGGVKDHKNDSPRLPDKMIVFLMKNLSGRKARTALNDAISHIKFIHESGLDWTVVRAPIITDKPGNGNYKVGYVGRIKGIKLSREDLADFIVKQIDDNKYVNEMPFLAN